MNIGQLGNITPEILGELFSQEKAMKLFKKCGGEANTVLDLLVGEGKRRYNIIVRQMPLDKELSAWEVQLFMFIQAAIKSIKNKDINELYSQYKYPELEKNGQIRISRFTMHGFTPREVRKMFRRYELEFENRLVMPSEQNETVPLSWWKSDANKPIQVPTLVLQNQSMWGIKNG